MEGPYLARTRSDLFLPSTNPATSIHGPSVSLHQTLLSLMHEVLPADSGTRVSQYFPRVINCARTRWMVRLWYSSQCTKFQAAMATPLPSSIFLHLPRQTDGEHLSVLWPVAENTAIRGTPFHYVPRPAPICSLIEEIISGHALVVALSGSLIHAPFSWHTVPTARVV